jgi:hypothetical protein
MIRKLIAFFLVSFMISAPAALFAADPQGAVLYGTGSVYLNGAQISNSSAVSAGDVIQTRETGTASLNATGSSVMIDSNSVVRFQDGALALDRGGISVATSNGTTVYAHDFKIAPVSTAWTQFYVSRVSGTIQIVARKNDVSLTCGATTSTIKEGQQLSREDIDNCGIAAKNPAAPIAAKGPILASPWVAVGGAAGGGFLLGWVIGRHEDVSPSRP